MQRLNLEARVTSRGQVTILAAIRHKFDIKAGTRLIVQEVAGCLVMLTQAQYVQALRGKYRGKALMRALRDNRANDDVPMKSIRKRPDRCVKPSGLFIALTLRQLS